MSEQRPDEFRRLTRQLLGHIFPDGIPPASKAGFDQAFASSLADGYTRIEATCMAVNVAAVALAPILVPHLAQTGWPPEFQTQVFVAMITSIVVDSAPKGPATP